ncbi:MAG: transcription-repair coupling factor [Saprospiraceae bacterium]|nr:transcription-repair coupling factor [Saprospiraceae bacterium]MBK9726794.1 transcription-repair coupling factor [Saprospiraceae bacterium]
MRDPKGAELAQLLDVNQNQKISIEGLCGSRDSFLILSSFLNQANPFLIICSDKEEAAYLQNDLEQFSKQTKVYFLPDSFRRPAQFEEMDTFQIQQRVDAISKLNQNAQGIIVSYPEAIFEKMISGKAIEKSKVEFATGSKLDLDDILIKLNQFGFNRTDFVYEPGQFSVRGGILDVFSYASDLPYRIELNDDVVESIRRFETLTQLSQQSIARFSIIPNMHSDYETEAKMSLFELLPMNTVIWIKDLHACTESLNKCFEAANRQGDKMKHYDEDRFIQLIHRKEYINGDEFISGIENYKLIFYNQKPDKSIPTISLSIHSQAQPSFNKNFNLLIEDIRALNLKNYSCFICTNSTAQIERFYNIFEDLKADIKYFPELKSIREGFIDHDLKIACYTDHQIFSRFHGYKIKQGYTKDQALSLKVLRELQAGDFVTHMDYGVGRFAGLEKLNINGQLQEAVRLIYRNDDILYVSIHSLHKISKFVGQEGTEPGLSKLGSDQWKLLKQRTKQKVKDIAQELIKLYGKRKAAKGFAFHPDNYLQAELEASFMYEDTPDQYKATLEVKADMEKPFPMDRLVCGDVGFGKTEVAIRAAFKAVQDGKQVAILVPTTILAMQHYRTLKERLKEFPVDVDYVSRFRTTKDKNQIIKNLNDGKLDIIIGTISILSAKIKFKDLGLLIIDEEQKFGVASKEKLRHLKHNVDTLTLTATPIPRTLQFSLMSARDLSVIQTPPPNRQPIHTERRVFNDHLIQEAIMHEVYRGGQVFFVHNKVKTLGEMAAALHRLCPTVDIQVAHGQMEAEKLEKVLVDFIDNKFDVLVCTNIIETGMDIPNANTIIINNAHQFGLSDLHQLRGRVGRSNRKAYCYLFAPPSSVLTMEARKRLKTIEEFSDLGSGFNVAMRDLDIRGAGNLLGGEQSGFIADIGYETYQRILEEAILELKETDFKELFADDKKEEKVYIRDVTIDSDIEMMIPDAYVSNIQERLNLYQSLDKLENEEAIQKFCEQIKDRFGPIPSQVEELLNGLRLRWVAKRLGFERVVLKKKKLQCYFISNPASPFFETKAFQTILRKVASKTSRFTLKQSNISLILISEHVAGFLQARNLLGILEGDE